MRLARPVATAVLLGLLCTTMFVLRHSGATFTSTTGNAGNSATSAALTPAGGLTATRGCSGLSTRWITLQWTGSTSSATTRYRVYRSAGGGAWTAVATVNHGANPHSHQDTGLATGTGYSYHVVAERAGTTWTSAASNSAGATTHGAICAG